MMSAAEEYVCALYGKPKLKSVNDARCEIFWDRYEKKKKIVELCMLPPCSANLRFHLKRSNYVAKIMRSTSLKTSADDYANHGWTETGEPVWASEYIPENIKDILSESSANDNDEDKELLEDEENEDKDEDDALENEQNEDEDEDIELADHS